VTSRQPTIAAGTPASRWSLRLILALVVLTHAFACQGAPASPPVPVSAVSCQSDVGHDTVCEVVTPAITAPAVRGLRWEDLAVDEIGDVVALLVITGLTARLLAGERASRRLLRGRHRLLTLCIARV
jgi:hypothetical protein